MSWLDTTTASAGTDSTAYVNSNIWQTTAGSDYSNYYIDASNMTGATIVNYTFQQQEWDNQIFYGSVGSYPFSAETEKERVEAEKKLLKAQERAEELKGLLMPKEQVLQLEMKNRVEIIAKNGAIYEILKNGKVNKLLKNGKKQGLCIYPKGGMYPVADEILAKKALLESDPEQFEEIANKVAAFPLAS